MKIHNSMIVCIQNAFSTVRRDRRGNVWVEYLVLVAMLGLAGIAAIKTLAGDVSTTATGVGTGIKGMTPYSAGN